MVTAAGLHKAITLYMVTACRIMLMTLLGCVSADMKAEETFADAKLYDTSPQLRLAEHTYLASAVVLVAIMGGYMNRKHDPPPGHTLMWRGYESSPNRAVNWDLTLSLPAPAVCLERVTVSGHFACERVLRSDQMLIRRKVRVPFIASLNERELQPVSQAKRLPVGACASAYEHDGLFPDSVERMG